MTILDILKGLPAIPASVREDYLSYLEPGGSWNNHYMMLEDISRGAQPESILEIGTHLGFGMIAMINGSHSVDRVAWVDNEHDIKFSNKMAELNLLHYVHYFGRGVEYTYNHSLDELDVGPGRFDLVFCDGEHTYSGTKFQLLIAYKYAPKFIVVDDYFSLPEDVGKAVDDWAESMELKFDLIETEQGIAVFPMEGCYA